MSRESGKTSENLAAQFLEKLGFRIIARNVTYAFGELDLVAKDGETLVFVEVKHRLNISYGMPFEAVTKSKQRKIIKAAQAFLQKISPTPNCRFDVISMVGAPDKLVIDHIKDAFWAEAY
jgi:putative endonuclease